MLLLDWMILLLLPMLSIFLPSHNFERTPMLLLKTYPILVLLILSTIFHSLCTLLDADSAGMKAGRWALPMVLWMVATLAENLVERLVARMVVEMEHC